MWPTAKNAALSGIRKKTRLGNDQKNNWTITRMLCYDILHQNKTKKTTTKQIVCLKTS